MGEAFQRMLERHGIHDAPTTSRNPQGNAVCERMHQSIANVLRTTLTLAPPQHIDDALQLVEDAIATTVYTTRVSVSRALGVSPGAMVFRRDMFVDLPILIDLVLIQEKRQSCD